MYGLADMLLLLKILEHFSCYMIYLLSDAFQSLQKLYKAQEQYNKKSFDDFMPTVCC